jgi:hypothetical protein
LAEEAFEHVHPVLILILLLMVASLGFQSVEMYTTDGSTSFAIFTNSLSSLWMEGIVSGVAPGAAACPLAAWTPWVKSVPMTIKAHKEKISRLTEGSFCLRNRSVQLIVFCRIPSRKGISIPLSRRTRPPGGHASISFCG